ncbi:hypothetical protein [Streptomyces prasinus]|uniref:hypothetical protein n=1 Tax=Streptomyces prasinus TaxID=67345 RepID=UPI0033A77C25
MVTIDFERRFARCSQLWDAARCRRNFRTHWQDEADRRFMTRVRSLFQTRKPA